LTLNRRRLLALRDDIDLKLGKKLAEPRAILRGDVGRQRQQDEQARHVSRTVSMTFMPRFRGA